MLVLPANAVSHEHRHATQAHEWQLSACLSLQRARVKRFRCANGFSAIHSLGSPCVSALAGIEPSSLRDSRRRTVAMLPVRLFCFQLSGFQVSAFSPWLHRADTCAQLAGAARTAPSVSPLRPASVTDSIVCRLSIRCRTPLHRFRGMLSLIPKSANHSRPSKFQRTRPEEILSKTSSLRSSRGSNRHCVSGSR